MRACRDCGGRPRDPVCLFCDACITITSECYRQIATVTTHVDFGAPVEPADLDGFRTILLERLPIGYRVELAPTLRTVELTVRRPDGRRFYSRALAIVGAP